MFRQRIKNDTPRTPVRLYMGKSKKITPKKDFIIRMLASLPEPPLTQIFLKPGERTLPGKLSGRSIVTGR